VTINCLPVIAALALSPVFVTRGRRHRQGSELFVALGLYQGYPSSILPPGQLLSEHFLTVYLTAMRLTVPPNSYYRSARQRVSDAFLPAAFMSPLGTVAPLSVRLRRLLMEY